MMRRIRRAVEKHVVVLGALVLIWLTLPQGGTAEGEPDAPREANSSHPSTWPFPSATSGITGLSGAVDRLPRSGEGKTRSRWISPRATGTTG